MDGVWKIAGTGGVRAPSRVRSHPEAYVGDLATGVGLHELVFGVCQVAITDARKKLNDAPELRVTLAADGTAIIAWNTAHPLALDLEDKDLRDASHAHRHGISIARALSSWTRAKVVCDGVSLVAEAMTGVVVRRPWDGTSVVDATKPPDGTRFALRPDALMFPRPALSAVTIATRLETWAHLVPRLTTILVDERDGDGSAVHERRFRGDLAAWVARLADGRSLADAAPIMLSVPRLGATAAFAWCREGRPQIHAYVGDLRVSSESSVVLRDAIARTPIAPGDAVAVGLVGLVGLVAVIAINSAHPAFAAADDREWIALVPGIADAIAEELARWFADHPADAAAIRARVDTAPPNLSPLARAVRAAPDDVATSIAHADELLDVGDPRGELIVIQHALDVETDAVERDALDRRAAELLDRDRAQIWCRPGGFPYRVPWVGRGIIGGTTDEILDDHPYMRIWRFLVELTDCTGPSVVDLPRHDHDLVNRFAALGFEAIADREKKHPRWHMRRPTPEPGTGTIHDGIRRIIAGEPELALGYELALADHGGPLPYQRAGWYANGLPLISTLTASFYDAGPPAEYRRDDSDDRYAAHILLRLALPFERLDGSAFRRFRVAAEGYLGCRLALDIIPP